MVGVMIAPNSPVLTSTHNSSFSPCSSPQSPFLSPKLDFSVRSEKKLDQGVLSRGDLTSFKRKRPPRLQVATEPAWSFTESIAGRGKRVEVVEEEGDGYAVHCKRGKRGPMEDRYCAVVDRGGVERKTFFGVFDGHGGSQASEFCAMNIEKNIMSALSSRMEGRTIENAIRSAYLKTDEEFLEKNERSGSCCLTAVIHNGDLVVSNAGDCRAVMSRGGRAEVLTSDHHASLESEQRRIESLGGYVDRCNGVWRIQGSLAVSRGIGDRHLKQWVTAEPETRIVRITTDCEFIILASDGLWDKVTNQEAVDLVRSVCVGVAETKHLAACRKLAELSIKRGSLDDVSLMLIQLHRFVN